MYIGLDGEMSGNDITKGSALIQIGTAIKKGDEVESIYYTFNPLDPDMLWDDQAELVHKISKQEIENSPQDKYSVDSLLSEWLIINGINLTNRMENIVVGWNVAGFDLPFIKKYLPNTFSFLSYRTLDLNALCFALDGKDDKSAKLWKKESKDYAEQKCPPVPGYSQHNAGWDAVMALNCLDYLKEGIFKR